MALANAAHLMACAGLRVLMIDFDLEAPGLEQYFPVDHKAIRAHAGLFDLILRYKAAMASSLPATPENQEFRRLQDLFIVPIYPSLPSGGILDLMPAGCRGNDEQLDEYALGLRQFDWQDFYFNFGGGVFFEWLRRSLDGKSYDIVLVDSRTGVTEMGGICAYQLADAIVVMCASNQQNLNGTHDVVRNFFADRVTMLRSGRPLHLLVVPARVEQGSDSLLLGFRSRFESLFGSFTPRELTSAGLAFWDLMIPYEPRSAFQEHVIAKAGKAGARSIIGPAIQTLVRAIGLLSDGDSSLRRLTASGGEEVPEAQYDVTTREAGFDVFLVGTAPDSAVMAHIAAALGQRGLRTFAFEHRQATATVSDVLLSERRALEQSGLCAMLVGAVGEPPWRSEYLRQLLEERRRDARLRFLPILMPGAVLPSSEDMPSFLADLHWLRLTDADADSELDRLAIAIKEPWTQRYAGFEGPSDRPFLQSERPPYKGLAPFDEADASIFFGRETLVERLIDQLDHSRLVVITGASGAGKTSVVRAGLIPALRRGALTGSELWHHALLRPGPEPTKMLLEALVSAGLGIMPSTDSMTAASEIDRVLEASDSRYLLVIDQAEELFTLSHNTESKATEFVRLLLHLATRWKAKIALVIVIRGDFFGNLVDSSPAGASLVQGNIVSVPPMTTAELHTAIEAPAQLAGLALEPGLSALILRDTGDTAAALPLLQYLMWSLWQGRQHGYLTVETYLRLGGVSGSLARDAEEMFARLPSPADRDKAMAILLRLIFVDAEGQYRRRVESLDALPTDSSAQNDSNVLERLVAARLVVVSRQGEQVTVELAHDAVIIAWPRFREQIVQLSHFLRLRTRLSSAARLWEEGARQRGFLYSEGELGLLRQGAQLERHAHELSTLERDFIEASTRALRSRKLLALAAAIGLVTLSVLALGAAWYAAWQREEALNQEVMAQRAARAAQREAELSRLAALGAASVVSPDGRRMLRIDGGGRMDLLDLRTGATLGRIAEVSDQVSTATFSPDGNQLALGTVGGSATLYDGITLKTLASLRHHESVVRRVAFSPDGKLLASASDDATAVIWDVGSRQLRTIFRADGPVIGLGFSPDGSRLTMSSESGGLYSFDVRSGEVIRR